MNKPNLNRVLHIMKMKEEAKKLYEMIDFEIQSIANEYGTDRFDYYLSDVVLEELYPDTRDYVNNLVGEGKPYVKFQVKDNLEKMAEDGMVWQSFPFKPYSFDSMLLKNKPKSLD